MHELKFCYAEFQFTQGNDIIAGEDQEIIKPLNQEELNVISYVKRDKDIPEWDAQEKPVSFMITQFHIIFMYK